MSIIEKIKENIRDIYQGGKGVITGEKTTPYSRKQERITSDYEKSRSQTPAQTGFTPTKDSSGRVSDARRGGGGGGGR